MATVIHQDCVSEALEKLHRQIELPYVAGDLSAWTDGVLALLDSTIETVRQASHFDHPKTYTSILRRDLELAQKVEAMRVEDEVLLDGLESIVKQAQELDSIVDEAKLAEPQFKPKRDRLVDDVLALIVRIRKQRAAINTWLSEAFSRDSGLGG